MTLHEQLHVGPDGVANSTQDRQRSAFLVTRQLVRTRSEWVDLQGAVAHAEHVRGPLGDRRGFALNRVPGVRVHRYAFMDRAAQEPPARHSEAFALDVEQSRGHGRQPGRCRDPAPHEPARVDVPPEPSRHRRVLPEEHGLDVPVEIGDDGLGSIDQRRLAEARQALVGEQADEDQVPIAVVQNMRSEVNDAHRGSVACGIDDRTVVVVRHCQRIGTSSIGSAIPFSATIRGSPSAGAFRAAATLVDDMRISPPPA